MKRNSQKVSILLVLTLMIVIFSGYNSAFGQAAPSEVDEGTTYTIKLGTTWPNDHPVTRAIDEVFTPYITEHTGGKVIINHMPNNQMGSERALYESVIAGQLEMVAIGNLLGNNMVPELNMQELPFIWNNEDEFWSVAGVGSPFCVNAQEALDQYGVTLVTLHKRGFRQTTSNRPLNSLADFEGLIMRMPEVEFVIKTWEAYKVVPCIIPWSEVYTALQQHVAEGSEGSLDSIYAQKLYEVQSNLAMTNHVLSIGMILSHTKYFETLPQEYKDVILKAGALLKEEVYKNISSAEEEMVKDMQAHGVEVTYPNRDEINEASKSVVIEYVENTACAKEVLEMFGKTDYLGIFK